MQRVPRTIAITGPKLEAINMAVETSHHEAQALQKYEAEVRLINAGVTQGSRQRRRERLEVEQRHPGHDNILEVDGFPNQVEHLQLPRFFVNDVHESFGRLPNICAGPIPWVLLVEPIQTFGLENRLAGLPA